jgi:predicted acetyltransferase
MESELIMESEFPIKLYDINDTKSFLEWRKLILQREIPEQFLSWLYFNSPFGKVHNYIAFDNEKIIAQYSTLPYEVYYLGEKLKASLCFDVATHPEYRNKGLFVKMGFNALKLEAQNEIAFTTGYPNDKAVPGHIKVGWYILGKRPILECKEYKKIIINNNHINTIMPIAFFDEEFDTLMEKHKKILPIIGIRSHLYLNWRYFKKPNTQYLCYKITKKNQLTGYFVLKIYHDKTETKLHIIDFLLEEDEFGYNDILQLIINISIKNSITLINIMINLQLPFAQYLLRNFFREEDHNNLFIAHKNNSQVNEKILNDLNNYYITFGDTDVY